MDTLERSKRSEIISHPETDVEHLNGECGSAGRMGTAPRHVPKQAARSPWDQNTVCNVIYFRTVPAVIFSCTRGNILPKDYRFPFEISSDSNTGWEPHSQPAVPSAALVQPASLDLVNCEGGKTAGLCLPLQRQMYWTTSANENSRELLGWFRNVVPQHALEIQRSSTLPYMCWPMCRSTLILNQQPRHWSWKLMGKSR